tara:strand:- start:370 stop:675 length:306 start_codon:yes stop_codon:yes gene_type:complete
MSVFGMLFGKKYTTQCTVDIENRFESLRADVELDDNPDLRPGDRVLVHGEAIVVPFGETRKLRREATVYLANPITRAWARLRSEFECFELFEVSFSDGSKL